MTKQELATQLGISQPTVATILKELEKRGLVKDGEIMESTGGRKPLCHMPIYDAKYSIGVESARNLVRIVMLDLGANPIAIKEYDLKRNYSPQYWKQVNGFIHDFIEEFKIDREKILDIGITIDETMKEELLVPSKSGGDAIDLEEAEKQFDFKVFIRSSSKMAAVAQIWTAEERDRFLYINLGTNIRGAMVFENLVIDYAQLNCEFGNMVLSGGQTPSRKLAEELSAESLLDKAGVVHVAEFLDKLDQGDAACEALLEEYIQALSIFLYNMHVIYGWDIIIGGRMSSLVSKYKSRIDEAISNLNQFKEDQGSVFTVSKHGEYSAVIGAAMLPIDRYF
ncbi:MAG: ROK family transcriptional regulator [Agathobacter sp.]|nr:ROK family transcriptional regulator [Agathobacter sp.]